MLLWNYPYLKIIAITMYRDTVNLQSLIRAGFMGCVFKPQIYEELPAAIDAVVNGKRYFPVDMDKGI